MANHFLDTPGFVCHLASVARRFAGLVGRSLRSDPCQVRRASFCMLAFSCPVGPASDHRIRAQIGESEWDILWNDTIHFAVLSQTIDSARFSPPVRVDETPINTEMNHLSTGAGFCPSMVAAQYPNY